MNILLIPQVPEFVGNDCFQSVSQAVQASGHLKNFMPLILSGTENNVA